MNKPLLKLLMIAATLVATPSFAFESTRYLDCTEIDFFGHKVQARSIEPGTAEGSKAYEVCAPFEYRIQGQSIQLKIKAGSVLMYASNYWTVGENEFSHSWQIRPISGSAISMLTSKNEWHQSELNYGAYGDLAIYHSCYYASCISLRDDGTLMGANYLSYPKSVEPPPFRLNGHLCRTYVGENFRGHNDLYLDRAGAVLSCEEQ